MAGPPEYSRAFRAGFERCWAPVDAPLKKCTCRKGARCQRCLDQVDLTLPKRHAPEPQQQNDDKETE